MSLARRETANQTAPSQPKLFLTLNEFFLRSSRSGWNGGSIRISQGQGVAATIAHKMCRGGIASGKGSFRRRIRLMLRRTLSGISASQTLLFRFLACIRVSGDLSKEERWNTKKTFWTDYSPRPQKNTWATGKWRLWSLIFAARTLLRRPYLCRRCASHGCC